MNRAENEQTGLATSAARRPRRNCDIVAVSAIGEIGAAAWDACANPPADLRRPSSRSAPAPSTGSGNTYVNPFLSHHFLSALETSKSVGGRTGWQAQHVLVKTADGDARRRRAVLP